ncbi:unnamed protein product [Caenorhabditis angaria]|uniref:Neurotransmitter-gated ion-channel ligand-binding domain-containing protein n=1 Tax=Caenorhabditis angaria TaxID=860376 RepID=A0A9P1MX51_9PELO|nr:unnamed protein product [Caenorhabditis angaria]
MPPYFDVWDNVNQYRFLNRYQNYTPNYIKFLPGMLKFEKVLFKDYDNQISPICDDFTTVSAIYERNTNWVYFIDVFRLKLLNINAQEEQVTVVTEIIQSWHDPRLEWNVTHWNDLKSLHVRLDKVWSPPMLISAALAGVFLRNTSKIDRLTIALTHIMTMTFILGIVADNLPRSTNVPLLGKTTKYFALKFEDSIDQGEKNQKHHLILSPKIRYIILSTFQLLNLCCFFYLLYRAYTFDRDFAFPYDCNHLKKNMDSSHELRREKMYGNSE